MSRECTLSDQSKCLQWITWFTTYNVRKLNFHPFFGLISQAYTFECMWVNMAEQTMLFNQASYFLLLLCVEVRCKPFFFLPPFVLSHKSNITCLRTQTTHDLLFSMHWKVSILLKHMRNSSISCEYTCWDSLLWPSTMLGAQNLLTTGNICVYCGLFAS